MPAVQMAANGAVNAAKWLGRGIQGAKDLAKHALVQDAKPIFQAARESLMKGDFAVQALAYGAVGGTTGYALSDDPKRGIRDGVALGVLGAAGHRLFKSPGLRSAFKGYGETLGRYADQAKDAVKTQAGVHNIMQDMMKPQLLLGSGGRDAAAAARASSAASSYAASAAAHESSAVADDIVGRMMKPQLALPAASSHQMPGSGANIASPRLLGPAQAYGAPASSMSSQGLLGGGVSNVRGLLRAPTARERFTQGASRMWRNATEVAPGATSQMGSLNPLKWL